ncbi:hypothetical protein DA2_2701 [Desulfovibrio sp. A2]|nr:hypothetical protein DA2_2701 [Desulfovibrio sp. A2]
MDPASVLLWISSSLRGLFVAKDFYDPIKKFLIGKATRAATDAAKDLLGICKDTAKAQSILFGMHSDKILIERGINTWVNAQNIPFTSPSTKICLPPYISTTVESLIQKYYLQFGCRNIDSDSKTLMWQPDTKILFGSRSINPSVGDYSSILNAQPLRFLRHDEIIYQLPKPSSFTRHFKSSTGTLYTKTSKTGHYLVNTNTPHAPPLGPFVNDDGKITHDVLLLTSIKVKNTRILWVTSGYGATIKFSDIVDDGKILEQLLRSAITFAADPYYQAAFSVSVTHTDAEEKYSKPKLIACTPANL